MKKPNEKKQDLLLDALSCIDDDILERGLSLRDGRRPFADESAPLPDGTTPTADLFRTPKLPKRKPWRVISVVAAACLLFCVVPLSVWLIADVGMDVLIPNKSESADKAPSSGVQNGILDEAKTQSVSTDAALPDAENTVLDHTPEEDVPSPPPTDTEMVEDVTASMDEGNVTESLMEEPTQTADCPECEAPEEVPIEYTCDLSVFPLDTDRMGYGTVAEVRNGKLLIVPGSEEARTEFGVVVWLVCDYADAYSVGQVVTYTFRDVKAPDQGGEPLNIIATLVYIE